MSTGVRDVVSNYFRELLFPRSRGCITVLRAWKDYSLDTEVFIVYLGREPFLELSVNERAIELCVSYPRCVAVWDDVKKEWQPGWGKIESFSQKPKTQLDEVSHELIRILTNWTPGKSKKRQKGTTDLLITRVKDGRTVSFDLCDPESLSRAEFYTQTIITKVKYMISNNKWYGHQAKKDLDFDDLIDMAKKDYARKVMANKRVN